MTSEAAATSAAGRESAARNKAHAPAVVATTAREPSARAYRDAGVVIARILTTAAERDAETRAESLSKPVSGDQ